MTSSFKGLAASTKAQSGAKRANLSTNTSIELLLRKALWSLGARYRVGGIRLLGRPDIVFPRHKIAVFCDGDFWHGRNWASLEAKLLRGSNPDYWRSKIAYNVTRDRTVTRTLERQGWLVIRCWETDIKSDPGRVASDVLTQLRVRQVSPRGGS